MITTILIIINCLIFFLVPPEFISAYGINPYTLGQPIVYFTSMFLHANLMHLIMNMLCLFQIGLLLEKNMSSFYFFLIYFICGLISSLASYMYITEFNAMVNVIGASGAIFGIWAFYARTNNDMNSFAVQAIIFHVLVFAFQLPVAWYAHLGGIISGLSISYLFKKI